MISCLRLVDLFTCYMFPLIASSKTPFLCARKCALSRRRHDRPGPLKPRLRCIPLTLVQHRPDRLRWSGLEDQGGWGMEGEVVWDAIISKMLWILRMLNDKHNCQLSSKETSAGLAWKSHMLGWKQWRLGRGGLLFRCCQLGGSSHLASGQLKTYERFSNSNDLRFSNSKHRFSCAYLFQGGYQHIEDIRLLFFTKAVPDMSRLPCRPGKQQDMVDMV